MLGETILDRGGMPSQEQLSAMGIDEPTARGIQSLVWLSKENSPTARRAVEAMVDLTAPQDTAPVFVPVGVNIHALNGFDGANSPARFRMVEFGGTIEESRTKVASDPNNGNRSTSLIDWEHDISSLAAQAPIEIPKDARVTPRTKVGYEQISFSWMTEEFKYEVRWHTRTPGAPKGQGNTWVVSRITPGTPDGQRKTEHIWVGNQWIPRKQWQAAIDAYRDGAATPDQLQLLSDGHWQAP